LLIIQINNYNKKARIYTLSSNHSNYSADESGHTSDSIPTLLPRSRAIDFKGAEPKWVDKQYVIGMLLAG
jgi:hypothetical protein